MILFLLISSFLLCAGEYYSINGSGNHANNIGQTETSTIRLTEPLEPIDTPSSRELSNRIVGLSATLLCDSTGPTNQTDCDLLNDNMLVCAGACNYCGDPSVEYGIAAAFDARTYPESCSGKVGGHTPVLSVSDGVGIISIAHDTKSSHYYTRLYVKDQDGNVIASAEYGPPTVDVSRPVLWNFTIPDGIITMTPYGHCNKHGLWVGLTYQYASVSTLNQLTVTWSNLVLLDFSSLREGGFDNLEVPQCDSLFDVRCSGTESLQFESLNRTADDQAMTSTSQWLDLSWLYDDISRAGSGGLLLLNSLDEFEARTDVSYVGSSTCAPHGPMNTNQSPYLSAFALLWAREHNRVAASLNQSLTDDELFDQAREKTISTWQHLTYTELLPLITDNAFDGSGIVYDESFSPQPSLEFLHAFQYYIESRRDRYNLHVSETWETESNIPATDYWWRSSCYTPGNIDNLIRGMIQQPERSALNLGYENIFRGYLFDKNGNHADLLANNIEESRKSKLQTWQNVRTALGLSPGSLYTDYTLLNYSAYDSGLESFDFLLGVALEPVLTNVLGETTRALVVRHFTNLAKADRLFYLHRSDLATYTQGDTINAFLNRNSDVAVSSQSFLYVPHQTCSSTTNVITQATYLQPFSQMLVRWSLDTSSGMMNATLTCDMSYTSDGWCSIGWNSHGSTIPMEGADYFVIQLSGGELSYYDGYATSLSLPSRDSAIAGCSDSTTVSSISYENGVITAHFSRGYINSTIDACDREIPDETIDTLFAFSTDGATTYHGRTHRQVMHVNWHTGAATVEAFSRYYIQAAHGVTMVAMFLCCYPWAVYFARFQKSWDLWLDVHSTLATIGIFSTLAIAFTAVSSIDGGTHLTSTHGQIGVVLCTCVAIQFGLGHTMSISKNYILKSMFARKTSRFIIQVHRFTGMLVIFVSPYACWLGWSILKEYEQCPEFFLFDFIWFWYIPVTAVVVGGQIKWNSQHGVARCCACRKKELLNHKSKINYTGERRMQWQEFISSTNAGNLWICIDNFVVDISQWILYHPGGRAVLTQWIGRDATQRFSENSFHTKQTLSKVNELVVAHIVGGRERRASSHSRPHTDVRLAEFISRTQLTQSDQSDDVYLYIFKMDKPWKTIDDRPNQWIQIHSEVYTRSFNRSYTPLPQFVWERFVKEKRKMIIDDMVGFAIRLYKMGQMSNVLNGLTKGQNIRFSGLHTPAVKIKDFFSYPVILLCGGTAVNPMIRILHHQAKRIEKRKKEIAEEARLNDAGPESKERRQKARRKLKRKKTIVRSMRMMWQVRDRKDTYLWDIFEYFHDIGALSDMPYVKVSRGARRAGTVRALGGLFGGRTRSSSHKVSDIQGDYITKEDIKSQINLFTEDQDAVNFIVSGPHSFVETSVRLLRSLDIEEEDIILLDHPHLLEKHHEEMFGSGMLSRSQLYTTSFFQNKDSYRDTRQLSNMSSADQVHEKHLSIANVNSIANNNSFINQMSSEYPTASRGTEFLESNWIRTPNSPNPDLRNDTSLVTPAPITAIESYKPFLPQPGNYRIDTTTTIRRTMQRLSPVVRTVNPNEVVVVRETREAGGIIYGRTDDGWLILFDGDTKTGPAHETPREKRTPLKAHVTMTNLEKDVPDLISDASFEDASLKKKISDGIAAASMDHIASEWSSQQRQDLSTEDVVNADDSLEMVVMTDASDVMWDMATSGGAEFTSDAMASEIVEPETFG